MTRALTPQMGSAHSGDFSHAVLVAHDVGLVLVDAHGVGVEVLLVVGALAEPAVRDRQVERGVRVGEHRDPSVGVHGGGVVEVGADVDLLDADLTPPVAQTARELTLPAPRGGLLVAAPEQQQLGVLGDVREQVALLALADGLATPDVLVAPPPAFPAVGLADLQGEATPGAQQLAPRAVTGLHDLVLAVLVALVEQCGRPILLLDALHLAGDDVQGLVPGDALVLAHAAVLRVALAVGVEIHAHHRVADTGGGVDAFLVGDAVRRDQGLHAGLERAATHLELPGVEIRLLVLPVVMHRADADDLAVLDVHHRRVGAVLRDAAETDVSDERLLAGGARSCSCPPPYPYLPMVADADPRPWPARGGPTGSPQCGLGRPHHGHRLSLGRMLSSRRRRSSGASRRAGSQYSRRASRRAARNAAMPAPSSRPNLCSCSRSASVTSAMASPGAQSGSACPAPTRKSSTRCGAVRL